MTDQPIQRKLAAILYADVAGYSRLTGADEVGTHEALRVGLTILTKAIESHGGRVNHYAGDAILAEFGSVVDCVNTAIKAQDELVSQNSELPDDKKLLFRVGINSGEVMIDGNEIYGDDVNIAARLESLAEPGGICLSGVVADQVRHRIEFAIEDMGDQHVKNIAHPIRAYRALLGSKVAPTPRVSSDIPSIAVLPFDNLSGDQEQDYFSDGIAEDIIMALSGVNRLHVTARNSSFSYKGQSPDVRDVAKDLDVRFVLEGSVRKAGDRVRISVQLIDGANGNHLWAERYDRELQDIFAVQDEITESVVMAVQPEITRAEMERSRTKHPNNLDAWDMYQRGMHHYFRFTVEDLEQAVELFRRAVELDPGMVIGHASLAYALSWLSREVQTNDLSEEAVRAGKRAIDLDGGDPSGYIGLGTALTFRAMSHGMADIGEAISTLEHGVKLSPSSTVGRTELATALAVGGRPAEGIDNMLTVIRLSPRDLNMGRLMAGLSIAYFAIGNYEAVLEWTTKIRRTLPQQPWLPAAVRVAALAKLDKLIEARAELKELLEAHPDTFSTFNRAQWAFRDELIEGLDLAGLPDG